MLDVSDISLLRDLAFVGGKWCGAENEARFAVNNPATSAHIQCVPNMGGMETRAAIASCIKAQPLWAAETAATRPTILMHWFILIHENIADLALILSADCSKPIAEARGEVSYGAGFVQWYAEEAKRVYGEIIPGHQTDKRLVVLRQPVGVVAAIATSNFPNAIITRKFAPAPAGGCAVVLKPSEKTPLSALALAVLAQRAGLPDGLMNVVTGQNSAEIGGVLCSDPDVRALIVTGSTAVGRRLMAQCALTIKKLGLELGSNAPFLVFDDADLDEAVAGAILAKFRNNGQTCVCASRFYVQAKVYDAFVHKLTAATQQLRFGSDGDLGPFINVSARNKAEAHVADALSKGARLLSGGARHALGGNVFQPTVMADLNQDMLIAHEETFGPVAAVFRFETDRQAIDLANASDVGLAAYVYTNDMRRVRRVAEALQTGMVGVDSGLISTELAPLGGIKQSGLGREGSRHGLDEHQETKYLCLGGI